MVDNIIVKKLLSVLELLNDIAIVIDKHGIIVDVNKIALHTLKCPKPKLIGRDFSSLFESNSRTEAREAFAAYAHSGVWVFEHYMQDSQGALIYVQSHFVHEEQDGEIVYVLVAKDVTSEKKIQERFQLLFENNPMPTIITRMRDGRFVDVNTAFEKFSEYKKSEVIGRTSIEMKLYSKSVREGMVKTVLAGGKHNFQLQMFKKGGKATNGTLFMDTFAQDNEQYLISVYNDQTSETRAHEALKKSLMEQMLVSKVASIASSELDFNEKIIQSLNDIKEFISICNAYIYDLQTNTYTYEVQKGTRLTSKQFSIDENDKRLILKRIGEDGLLYSGKLSELSAEVNSMFNPYNAASVLVIPIFSSKQVVAILGFTQCIISKQWDDGAIGILRTIGDVFSNMYENKYEEGKIRESLQENVNTKNAIMNILEDVEAEKDKSIGLANDLKKFEMAVSHTSDHITIANREGKIIYGNVAGELTTGFTIAESLGKKPGELWGGDMPPEFYEKMWNTLAKEKQSFKSEFSNHRKNGEVYIEEINISPIQDEQGEIIYYVGLGRDITKIKEIDKMKNEFISIASHQLRTPLSATKWYLEMLLAGDAGELNPQQLDFAQNLQIFNQRMIDLVNSLLNVSRIESGRIIIEPHPTDIKDLIDGIVTEVEAKSHDKKIKLQHKVQSSLPLVNLDPRLIRNAILNLLTNAIKYSPDKTTVSISVKEVADHVLFTVADQGFGIPKEDQGKVFTKFYRGKNIVKIDTDGNGLGLYLVKSIIDSSGGEIWYESKLNVGTTFFFKLPIKGVPAKAGEVTLD